MDHIRMMPQSDLKKSLPSVNRLATNLSVSSRRTTGIENFITVIHSSKVNGVTWNTV